MCVARSGRSRMIRVFHPSFNLISASHWRLFEVLAVENRLLGFGSFACGRGAFLFELRVVRFQADLVSWLFGAEGAFSQTTLTEVALS